MDPGLKKILKSVTLELRHLLEGRYDSAGAWEPGDLEQRLAAIGVRRDRASLPIDELSHLSEEDKHARKVVDAYLKLREDSGVKRTDAIADFVRETAYTWANRLLALRCMEARELIDEVITQKEAYGGRSLEHHRLAQRQPELCAGEDDGLFAVLDKVFRDQAERLPMLFDPNAPGIALRPSPAAIKDCFALLSLDPDTLRKYRIRIKEDENADADTESANPFVAPDALGWAYQYWNTEEKDRVFERVRTVKGAKIAGADIVPATQLYTEDYMVKFLVQNSLGATWMGMHPESKLADGWEYYVKDADRGPVERKPVSEITFLDPACGSGHFLLEAFDLFYAMYAEEGQLTQPETICDSILTKNLFGIDIDPRAVQIAEVALWMKAAERAFDYHGVPTNLVAATASHLKGEAWEEFLAGFEREPSVARVLRKFAESMEHIDEIGSLARPDEDLREIIRQEHATWERQVRERKETNFLFPEMNDAAVQGQLPFNEISDEDFGDRLFYRARAAIDGFTERARAAGDFEDQLLGSETRAGFRLVDLLSRRYEVVTANPPYMSSKSMSLSLLTFLKDTYPHAAFDLFASFIDRILSFTAPNGVFACVTMQSFMFTTSYENLRDRLLSSSSLTHLVVLGAGAFSEISGEVVSTALTIGRATKSDAHGIGIRLQASKDKSTDLMSSPPVHSFRGSVFSLLPGRPFAFWLPPLVLTLLQKGPLLRECADVVLGMKTADNDRFHREWHEPPFSSVRWKRLVKSVAGCRYYSYPSRSVDWSSAAVHHYSSYYSAQLPNKKYWFREGVGYTDVSTSSFCAQYMPPGGMSDFKANLVACHEHTNVFAMVAFLNSSFARYLLWIFNPTMGYQPNDLQRLPVTDDLLSPGSSLSKLGKQAVSIKEAASTIDPASCDFSASDFIATWRSADLEEGLVSFQRMCEEMWLTQAELDLQIDVEVFSAFGIDEALKADVWHDQGTPVASHGEGALTRDALSEIVLGMYRGDDVTDILSRTALESESTQRIRENYLDEIGARIAVHPKVIRDVARSHGCANSALQLAAGADLISVVILHLLGYRWPKQIDAGESVPEWADSDGIIPLTPLVHESTLVERLQAQLNAAEIHIGDFAKVMGKPLGAWLVTDFFKYHTGQFKKRPIAWQLQSGKFTAKKSPAFACLVNYHKLDADTLRKIHSQYVGPLRERLGTELRGIHSVAAEARSDRQEERRVALEDAIKELTALDTKLEQVAREGFATPGLAKLLAEEPLDRWCSLDGKRPHPTTTAELIAQESAYAPDINDGVRVNIAPLQKAGLLAADVLAKKDLDKAIADRAEWRADERRWVREGKLPQPGWWPEEAES